MDRLRRKLTVVLMALGAALGGGLAACGGEQATARAEPVGTADSANVREDALARFREGLPAVTELDGGAPSRDALIALFVDAIERSDTAALRLALLTRAEFAWLYYPTNPQGLPPYDLPPDLMWDMLSLGSGKGLRRALRDFGGQHLGYVGYECDPQSSRQGENTVSGPCALTLARGGDTVALRLFGLVIERDQRWKFVSYANKL